MKISKASGQWTGESITINYHIDPETHLSRYKNHRIATVEPKSGWKTFAKTINDLRITSLPDMSESGLSSGDDGTSYMVEIATTRYYRFYRYWSPEIYQEEYPEANAMCSIVKILESEFDFKFAPGLE